MTHRKHTHTHNLEPEKLGFNFWGDHLLAKWFGARHLIPSQHQFVIYKQIKIMSPLYDYYEAATHSADPSKNDPMNK